MASGAATTPERKPRKAPPRKINSNDQDLLSKIATKSSVLLHPQVTLTCYIPTQLVGAVIGRRGSTILQIQKQAQQVSGGTTSVRVSIVGHEDRQGDNGENPAVPYTYSELDWTCPNWTPVVIRADPCAALVAAQLLTKLVEGEMDEVVLDLPLSRTRHAALVGKRGVILANLSADTGVRIMVPRKDLRHDVVQLEGELDNVKVCLERVLTLASESTKKNKGNKEETATEQETVTVTSLPPPSKLRQIMKKTDTSIKKKKNDNDEWLLTVAGNQLESIQSAVALLEKWNEEAGEVVPRPRGRRKNQTRKKGGGRGGGGPPPSAVAPAAEPTSSS